MATKENLKEDLKSAMEGRRELEVSVLRQLLAAILNKEKEKLFKLSKEKPEMPDGEREKESRLNEEELMGVVSFEAKKRREAIPEYERGARLELAEKEKKELEILQKYLPEQISEEEIKRIVAEAIKETGALSIKDMGKVMAQLMPKTKGKADGNLVSRIVKESLS